MSSSTSRTRDPQRDAFLDAAITEDLDETQLAQASFAEEIVVYWDHKGEREHGIIVGYRDPDAPGGAGLFEIDMVEPISPVGRGWEETGGTVHLKRTQFVVFGPANRDGDEAPVQTPSQVAVGLLESISGFSPQLSKFLAILVELEDYRQTDTGERAFDLRLDLNMPRQAVQRGKDPYLRESRLLVRPLEAPMLHEEMQYLLNLAGKYELAAFHAQAGMEIREPNDVL